MKLFVLIFSVLSIPAFANQYHDLLGVAPGATKKERRDAWLKKVLKHHPDQFAGDTAARKANEEILKNINAAYEALERGQEPPLDASDFTATSTSPETRRGGDRYWRYRAAEQMVSILADHAHLPLSDLVHLGAEYLRQNVHLTEGDDVRENNLTMSASVGDIFTRSAAMPEYNKGSWVAREAANMAALVFLHGSRYSKPRLFENFWVAQMDDLRMFIRILTPPRTPDEKLAREMKIRLLDFAYKLATAPRQSLTNNCEQKMLPKMRR